MRRAFAAGALFLVAGVAAFFALGGAAKQSPVAGRFERVARYGGRGWPTSIPTTSSSSYAFCDQLQSGDKVGAWACVNGDITSPAGSALAFAGVNSPVATVGTTCASPSYQTLANGSTDSYIRSTTTMATPSGDFTICALFEASSTDHIAIFMLGAYDTISPYAVTTESSGGVLNAFFKGGNEQSATFDTITTGAKALGCVKWTAATKTGTAYYKRTGITSSETDATANSAVITVLTQRLQFGAEGTSFTLAGKIYGGFITETKVSKANLDALFTATVTCP